MTTLTELKALMAAATPETIPRNAGKIAFEALPVLIAAVEALKAVTGDLQELCDTFDFMSDEHAAHIREARAALAPFGENDD